MYLVTYSIIDTQATSVEKMLLSYTNTPVEALDELKEVIGIDSFGNPMCLNWEIRIILPKVLMEASTHNH